MQQPRAMHLAALLLVLLACGLSSASAGKVPQFDTSSWQDVRTLQIEVLELPEVCKHKSAEGDKLYVHYTGFLVDGTVVHTSREENFLYDFVLGSGAALTGVEKGMYGACVGEKRLLKIPSQMAFGEIGSGETIPPNSTIIYELEIVQLKTKAQMASESGPDEYEDPDGEEAAVEGGPKDEL